MLVLESVHGNIYYIPVKEMIDTNSASETCFNFVKEQARQTDCKWRDNRQTSREINVSHKGVEYQLKNAVSADLRDDNQELHVKWPCKAVLHHFILTVKYD